MKKTSYFRPKMRKIFKTMIDYLFPPQCPDCGTIISRHQVLCDNCFNRIRFINRPICHRCGRPMMIADTNEKLLCARCLTKRPTYDMCRSVFIYDSYSRNTILKLKYTDRTDLRHFFVKYMLQAGADLFAKTDIIIPVPLYWFRRIHRKYNQAAVLSELIAQKTGIPHGPHILKRIRHTPTQTRKTLSERKKNVHGAFTVTHPDKIKGKTVLLIDDVLTTGSTANACAKTLKQNGALAVYVLTIAQAVIE